MGRGRLRNWWSLGAVAGLAVATAWLLYLIWLSPHRDDLATYGAFAVSAAAVVAGWLAWAWRKGMAGQSAGDVDGDALDQASDRLAVAVLTQWEKAAEVRGLTGADPIRVTWGRPSLPMAGPLAAAASSHRFGPLPGLAETRKAKLASGQAAELHALYGGLRSGRLIIAGPPGSGKTSAAVLLLLAALRHRGKVPARERPEVPVPVLFTAQDWDPGRQPAAEWLTGKLQDTYPLFAGDAGAATAAALLASGRITVILDGLDEISPGLRPVALTALSRQATFRLIILSRTTEIAAAAASQGILQGAAAVELSPVSPDDAASYLGRTQLDPPPAGWQELIRRIRVRHGSALSTALNNPLALSLVRDTYQAGDSVSELLEFCGTLDGMPVSQAAEAITGHLLDRIVPAAYAPLPGQPRPPYDPATAQRALTRIAVQMNRDGTRDLNWWRIPSWISRAERAVTSGLVVVVPVALVAGLADWSLSEVLEALSIGLAVGVGSLLARSTKGKEGRTSEPQARRLAKWKRLIAWVVVWYVLAVTITFTIALAIWLIAKLANSLAANPGKDDSLNPAASRRRNRNRGFVFAVVFWLGSGILLDIAISLVVGRTAGLSGIWTELTKWLPFTFIPGLVIGVLAGVSSSVAWRLPLTEAQLTIKWRTPVRMMKFLDDAYKRNVMRAVGPSYQFRHARLQDRLADAANSPDGNVPRPRQRPWRF
jgi:hypothetical protein